MDRPWSHGCGAGRRRARPVAGPRRLARLTCRAVHQARGEQRADPGRPSVHRPLGGEPLHRRVTVGEPRRHRRRKADPLAGPGDGDRSVRRSGSRRPVRSPGQCRRCRARASAGRPHRRGRVWPSTLDTGESGQVRTSQPDPGWLSEPAGTVCVERPPVSRPSAVNDRPAGRALRTSTTTAAAVRRRPAPQAYPRGTAVISFQSVSKVYPDGTPAVAGPDDRDPHRQDHRVRRSVRLRQDHVAADDQPDDRADRRRRADRRQGHPQHRRADAAPGHRVRHPERRTVPAPHRAGQRGDRPGAAGPEQEGGQGRRGRPAGQGRTGRRDGQPLPGPAVRRAAATGRGGQGAGRRSAGAADGRAVLRRRPGGPHATAGRVDPAAGRTGQDHRVRHPRHRRGGQARRSDRGLRGRRPAGAVRRHRPRCSAGRRTTSSRTSSAGTAATARCRSSRPATLPLHPEPTLALGEPVPVDAGSAAEGIGDAHGRWLLVVDDKRPAARLARLPHGPDRVTG